MALAALGALPGCWTTAAPPPAAPALPQGTISYPFAERSDPLGRNGPTQPFVIRSIVGNTEYAIQIPYAAEDYDVVIPLAELGGSDDTASGLPNPAGADRELLAALPRLEDKLPAKTALLDQAFGVAPREGPGQAPSYVVGLGKITDHYRNRRFEHALVAINDMLAFYPNSPKLHKMKGTVLVRLRNWPLAEKAWLKALQLKPDDVATRRAVERLQARIAREREIAGQLAAENASVPPSVSTPTQ